MTRKNIAEKQGRSAKIPYKKLAVQWLNEAICFVTNFVVADSFRLRNSLILIATDY